MSYILTLFSLASLILLVVGFFSPNSSLFWESNKEKRTRVKSLLVYMPLFIVFEILLVIFSPNDSSEGNKASQRINDNKKDWYYEKDIDLNTGDTINKASLFSEGPYLSYYRAGNIAPNAILTFSKKGKELNASVYLTLGEFIKGDTIDVYFKGLKPDARYTYKLKSNKEAILNIPNIEAFMKKVNMECVMTLEIPIPKQGSKTVFGYMYKENSLKFN